MSERRLKRIESFDLKEREHLGFQRRIERTKLFAVAVKRVIAVFLITIDRAQHRANPQSVEPQRFQIIEPKVTIAKSHIEILLGQTEGAETLNQQRDQFDLRLGSLLPENIRVELAEA